MSATSKLRFRCLLSSLRERKTYLRAKKKTKKTRMIVAIATRAVTAMIARKRKRGKRLRSQRLALWLKCGEWFLGQNQTLLRKLGSRPRQKNKHKSWQQDSFHSMKAAFWFSTICPLSQRVNTVPLLAHQMSEQGPSPVLSGTVRLLQPRESIAWSRSSSSTISWLRA